MATAAPITHSQRPLLPSPHVHFSSYIATLPTSAVFIAPLLPPQGLRARALPPAQARSGVKCAASARDRNRHMRFSDELDFEPLWLTSVKDAVWAVRSLVLFLFEQPSQLTYNEWPTFQNTLKTTTLTLVLVAVLIVALSSIDAALSFMLATFLRKRG